MKWYKIGKIFEPVAQFLPNKCLGFAQSPQALVLADRIRIYFSTREADMPGKYLSHVTFVDFNLNLDRVIGFAKNPVIELGKRGCFDEHGMFPFHVLKDGSRVLAYISGWSRRVSVPVDGAIGLAISEDDGLSFEKYGVGPIMASTFNEPFMIGDPFVSKHAGLFHMWYIFGSSWKKSPTGDVPDRVYKIAHAESRDGINWERDGKFIISDKLDENECQALPTVFYRDGRYHMYFCYRQARNFKNESLNSYRLGYAFSNDLLNWTRDDSLAGIDVSDDGWDSEMQCYPHVFHVDDQCFMLYNGNEFGRYGFGLAILES